MNMALTPGRLAAGAFTTVTGGGRRHGGASAHGRWRAAGAGALRRLRARREHAHFDRRGAGQQHVELGGGGVGQVDDAIADERAAIVDAHDDLAAVAQVGDLGVAGDGQRLVRGRHGVHVVALAQRGGLRREIPARTRRPCRAPPSPRCWPSRSSACRRLRRTADCRACRAARRAAPRRESSSTSAGGGGHRGAGRESAGRGGCSGWRRERLQPPRAMHRTTARALCALDTNPPMQSGRVMPFPWRRLYAQRAAVLSSSPGLRAARCVAVSRAARSGGRAHGDGLREVVHRHGVADAAVVARDDFEILEADAVGRPDLRLGRHQQHRGVRVLRRGIEVHALGLEARRRFR